MKVTLVRSATVVVLCSSSGVMVWSKLDMSSEPRRRMAMGEVSRTA
jgi:hypothetical protein